LLGSLFIGQTVTAIEEALASAKIDGVVGVVEQLKIGSALSSDGRDVVLFSSNAKALKKHGDKGVLGSRESLPVDDASLDALVGFELGAVSEDEWETILAEWSRVTRDGGVLILVDKAAPTEMTRRALCGGLAEIQQRAAGRTTVTSGLVTRI
jgi:SAM-dependent methyltransferase